MIKDVIGFWGPVMSKYPGTNQDDLESRVQCQHISPYSNPTRSPETEELVSFINMTTTQTSIQTWRRQHSHDATAAQAPEHDGALGSFHHRVSE
jgi:hypothetical protein